MRTHGASGTAAYRSWAAMLTRCHNSNSAAYKHYGARGIAVCDRWRDFPAFLEDMGVPPDAGMEIDRIDVNLGYSKDNCRWATLTEQANNKRNNHYLEWRGERRSIADWAREVGLKAGTIRNRVHVLGWAVECALSTPPRPPGREY